MQSSPPAEFVVTQTIETALPKSFSKKVVRLDVWIDGAFDQRLARERDITLSVGAASGDDSASWQALQGAHVYHVSAAKDELPRQWFVQPTLLARCPELLCVSSTGAGYDTIDVAACTAAGVLVVNQAGGNARSVAEHTFGLMLGVSRRMVECDRRMRREQGFSREDVMGHEIGGKVLGLVGLGHVGTMVATIAKVFGMTVLAYDPLLSLQTIEERGATAVGLDELLAQSDVVSLHCPRDASTLQLMDASRFAQMKAGAIFITTARGGIHNEAALTEALRSGHLAGAGIDVWDAEPPPLDHSLLQMDQVYATFHTAGVTHEARRNMASIAADQIVDVLDGVRPARLINPQVWPTFLTRLEAARRK